MINKFWGTVIKLKTNEMPDFLRGDSMYGPTDLQSISSLGLREFSCGNPRAERKTFALRIGYDGSKYNGYQRQKGVADVRTVEEDVFQSLGRRSSVAAGRTDKGVSAVSQIISFHTRDNIDAEQLLETVRKAAPCEEGSLFVSDVARVPRRFHALFSATWRRYIYMFPLKHGPYTNGFDVDVQFVHEALQKLEGLALPYNGFAFREARDTGKGSSDICTMYRAKATMIDISAYVCPDANAHPEISTVTTDDPDLPSSGPNITSGTGHRVMKHPVACIELVGSRFLRRMVRLLVVRMMYCRSNSVILVCT
jgi:tRNA pseudouridine(38-40) synthase